MWVNHRMQTCIEVDVGALHVLWIPRSASQAFAPSSLELIDRGEWAWSGWRPRIDCDSRKVYFALPMWVVGVALLVVSWRLRVRQAPPMAFACRTCGYNVRGNLSGICPECGLRIEGA